MCIRDSRQLGQNTDLRLSIQLQTIPAALHADLQPIPHVVIVDVHKLNTDRTTVGLSQLADNLFESPKVLSVDSASGELSLHVTGQQRIRFGVKFSVGRSGNPQRVDVSLEVPADSKTSYQLIHTILQLSNVGLGVRKGGSDIGRSGSSSVAGSKSRK